MFTLRRVFAIAALAATASAQLANLTAACNSTLAALAQDSTISSCLGVANLNAIAVLISNNSTTSLVDPINTWLVGVCAAPVCSNDTLTSAANQLSTGCNFEIPQNVLNYYPTARKALCLQQGSTNCVTQTLTNIQKDAGGALNIQTITNLVSLSNIPTSLTNDTSAYCTDCTKAIYNTISNDIPQFSQAGYGGLFQQQCGASFTNGTIPSTVSESFSNTSSSTTSTGATNTTSPKSGALGAISTLSQATFSGLGASALVVISTLFAFLA